MCICWKSVELKQLHFILYMGVFGKQRNTTQWWKKIRNTKVYFVLRWQRATWHVTFYTQWPHCVSLVHRAANHKENTLWHTSQQCAPNILKSCCMVTFFIPNASTSWLYFTATETLAVNRTPIKSSGTIQCLERLALSYSLAKLVSGSCTHAHWPRSKLSLQRALSNLSQHCMMWECSLQSPRCFQSAGLLPSSSPTFGTVWIWSATINHWKHSMKSEWENLIKWNWCWHFWW